MQICHEDVVSSYPSSFRLSESLIQRISQLRGGKSLRQWSLSSLKYWLVCLWDCYGYLEVFRKVFAGSSFQQVTASALVKLTCSRSPAFLSSQIGAGKIEYLWNACDSSSARYCIAFLDGYDQIVRWIKNGSLIVCQLATFCVSFFFG